MSVLVVVLDRNTHHKKSSIFLRVLAMFIFQFTAVFLTCRSLYFYFAIDNQLTI